MRRPHNAPSRLQRSPPRAFKCRAIAHQPWAGKTHAASPWRYSQRVRLGACERGGSSIGRKISGNLADLGTLPSRKGWFRDASHCVIGDLLMLPLLALTYTAARLGMEAQSAAAFRLLRLGAGITKAAEEIVPDAPMPPADMAPAPVAAAPKRRHAARKIHKKSAPVGKRGKRAQRG
jgi:hypothetical protein